MQKLFKETICELNELNIEFIIIGGWALALNQIKRSPKDLDIWIHNTELNLNLLTSFFDYKGFDFDSNKNFYITFGPAYSEINFLSNASGLEFQKSISKSLIHNFENQAVNFLCLDDIIINKQHVGRDKDINDIKNIKNASITSFNTTK